MKNFMFLNIAMLLLVTCCSPIEGEEPTPPPPPKPVPELTIITIGEVPTSVNMGTSTSITFVVAQKDHAKDFKIEVSTESSGSAQITINGKDLESLTSIVPNKENTIVFANPTAAGEYKMTLNITDQYQQTTTKEIKLTVLSPEPTTITIGEVPASTQVETSTSITFTVAQKDHAEEFKIQVDTIVPNYWIGKIFEEDGSPRYQHQRFGSAGITINGKDLKSLTPISPNQENTIMFANPTAVGEYKIKLKITDKHNIVSEKEIALTVVSPEIEIRWYSQYILGYYWDDIVGNIYESLNNDFSFSPLSESLREKQIDALFTQMTPTPGCAEEELECINAPCDGKCVSTSGATMLIHVSQEGGEPMQYVRGTYNYLWNENGYLSTTQWWPTIDGKDSFGFGKDFKQGFHGVRFETATSTAVGTMHYTIRVVDKWGKEYTTTLPYKCFDIDETIPDNLIHSDEYPYWWYTKVEK